MPLVSSLLAGYSSAIGGGVGTGDAMFWPGAPVFQQQGRGADYADEFLRQQGAPRGATHHPGHHPGGAPHHTLPVGGTGGAVQPFLQVGAPPPPEAVTKTDERCYCAPDCRRHAGCCATACNDARRNGGAADRVMQITLFGRYVVRMLRNSSLVIAC